MKTFSEWAKELPAYFKTQMLNTFMDLGARGETYETIKKAVDAFMVKNYERLKQSDELYKWEGLLRSYMNNEEKLHHVSYWIEPDQNTGYDKSTGVNVYAFDMYHAIDIVQAVYEVPISQIIYALAKESVYQAKKSLK